MFEYSAKPLIDVIPKNKPLIGLEIGCDKGDSSIGLLEDLPNILKLISIDPYTNYIDWNGVNENTRDLYFEYTTSRLKEVKTRHELVRKSSDEAVSDFVDGAYDFIFIDGLHTYEQVLTDCRNYYSKIKSGGIFAGHDYRVIAAVRNAVDEFFAEINQQVSYSASYDSDVWYLIKP
jgi:predicted O-methyltransferase YrrM